jgi:hypothetical protein
MNSAPHTPQPWFRSRSGIVLLAFLAIAAFFLVTEHAAHVFGVLPYVLLLACPVMHFLHGGHTRGHREHRGPPPDGSSR